GGPSLHGLKPPKSDTLVAMPAGSTGGALQVTVSDSGGGPVQFVNVNATSTTGGGTQTAQTNASGCALFTTLPNGTYDVTAQKTGYIDRNGNAAPKVSAQHVFAGQTRSVAFTMEQAGWLNVTFWTNANGWTQTTSPDQQWDRVTTTSGGVTRICGTPRVANGVAAVT